jgi:GNAT superfamily N-acetyltransferase
MVDIVEGWRSGAIAAILRLHVESYAQAWGFGLSFEAEIASGVSAFWRRFDTARDRVFLALQDGRIVGSLVIDGSDPEPPHPGARLRWFVLAESLRGQGTGERMMREAMAFIDAAHGGGCSLTTFSGLDAARVLYRRHGFALFNEYAAKNWGDGIHAQLYVRPRKADRGA